jgi:hypothetical protein
MVGKIRLLEAFKDFEVKIKSDNSFKKVILTKSIKTITEKDLKAMVIGLRAKYPDKNYRLVKRKIAGKTYLIIRRGKASLNNPPVYFDLEAGKVLVPQTYVKKVGRLVNSVILYRLNPLGIVKVR